MEHIKKLPIEKRRELNRLYRNGVISRKQLMEKMKNGLFDHERLELKEKFKRLIRKEE
jgi:hypothetical protein